MPVVRMLMHRNIMDADADVLGIEGSDDRLPAHANLLQRQQRRVQMIGVPRAGVRAAAAAAGAGL